MSNTQKIAPAATEANSVNNDTLNIPLCSGFGQWHSPNNERSPKPYATVTMAAIDSMLENPAQTDKEQAQWVIFSSLASRVHSEQLKHGEFYALWADIDEPQGIAFDNAFTRIASNLQIETLAYTSRSATKTSQKARFIFPLAHPISGHDFVVMQKILNDKIEALGIKPDRVTERPGQICYLPNRGKFYLWECDPLFSCVSPDLWGNEIAAEYEAQEQEQRERKARLEQSRQRATKRMQSGEKSPVAAYNGAYDWRDLWQQYGAKRIGKGFVSPYSESSKAGIKELPDEPGKWVSHHGSDIAHGVGKVSADGSTCFGDAFDLFVHFENGGDYKAALKAAGAMFTDSNGVSITKQNQQAYAEQAAEDGQAAALAMLDNHEQKQTSQADKEQSKPLAFDFKKFSLNGSSAAMRAQMLEDSFVLDGIAILGQATAIYAKPNSGKTLLTIYLLCDGIKRGEVKAEDVFYINADDNYKGLVTKLEIAEQNGFNMVAPGFNDFNVNEFALYMAHMIKADDCRGKVIILDTLKKFTNIMDKKVASDFGKIMRGFVTKGGTMIMLAHTNKNRDTENKVVFSGTSDVVDDVDCAYTLDVTEFTDTSKTVLFENIKSRGDVEQSVAYRYENAITAATGGYPALLASVEKVSEADAEEAKRQRGIMEQLERNAVIIEAIQETLEPGELHKTELIEVAHKLCGVSKERITKTLNAHTGKDWSKGHRWTKRKGEKNSYLYRRLSPWGESDPFGGYDRAKNGE